MLLYGDCNYSCISTKYMKWKDRILFSSFALKSMICIFQVIMFCLLFLFVFHIQGIKCHNLSGLSEYCCHPSECIDCPGVRHLWQGPLSRGNLSVSSVSIHSQAGGFKCWWLRGMLQQVLLDMFVPLVLLAEMQCELDYANKIIYFTYYIKARSGALLLHTLHCWHNNLRTLSGCRHRSKYLSLQLLY